MYGARSPLAGAGEAELRVRSSVHVVSQIAASTWIFEGEDGDVEALTALDAARGSAPVTVKAVPGHDHSTLIAPVSSGFARDILETWNGSAAVAQ